MAYLIPDNLRSRKDVPEQIRRVASALASGLDEDVTVWYEPLFDPAGERPHLVVLEPRIGVVVIEVLAVDEKRKLLGGVKGKLRLEINGKEEAVESPLTRALAMAVNLKQAVESHEQVRHVPIGAAAVLPSVNRDEAEKLGIGSVVSLDLCICRSDLERAISEGDGEPIVRVLRHASDGHLASELSEPELGVLRGLIHPEVVIGTTTQGALFSTAAGSSNDVIKVMDRRQEAFAKSLGSGHRVIRGVAGSGKTLVLVNRARLLAKLLPSQKILVTCYTKSLASQLAAQVSEYSNIEVVNLDRLMAKAIRDAGLKHPGYEVGAPPVESVALEAVKLRPGPKYRAVMVDEAQDFDTDALRFCLELLESADADSQDLVIVADSAQNIFRRNFRWKDAGIQAQGRTRLLRVNYRNTREILEFAHGFLTADPSIPIDLDGDDGVSVIPAESCERSGANPCVKTARTIDEEVEAVARTVTALAGPSPASRSVAVLYGEDSGARPKLIAAKLRQLGLDVFWVTDPDNKSNKERAGSATESVILSTIQSAKGLEFPSVVVCGLGVRDDPTTARKLLYVGFTRAINQLHVVVAQDSPFRSDVDAALARGLATSTT